MAPHRCTQILRVETAQDFGVVIAEAVCIHGFRWVTERSGVWTAREPVRAGHHKTPRPCTLCGEPLTGDETRAGSRGGPRLHDACRVKHRATVDADHRDGIRELQCRYCRSRLSDASLEYCDRRCRDASARDRVGRQEAAR